MNIFAKIWAWFTGLFKSAPKVDEKADLETVPDIAPNDDDVVPVQGNPSGGKTEHQKDVEFTRDAIAKHAELYETNQKALMEDYTGDPGLFIEAAYLVDWPAVVSRYSDKTMHRKLGHGTHLNFKGHDDLRRLITDAIDEVHAERSAGAPDRNGMAPDGGQRR